MNDEQQLRLRVASEQMAAMTVEAVPTDSLSRCVVICRKHEYRGDGLEDRMAFAAVKMADALIAEIERTAKAAPVEPAPEKHPGWVITTREGAWGFDVSDRKQPYAIEGAATRPFKTIDEAQAAEGLLVDYLLPGVKPTIRPWRPTDRVPPMPEGE